MPALTKAPTANRADERGAPPPAEFWRVSPDVYAGRSEMAESAERGEYRALHEYLKDGPKSGAWRASFAEIERVLGFALPPSARTRPAWWANDGESEQSRAWIGAGWQVDEADVESERAAFRRWATLPKSPNGLSDFLKRPPTIGLDHWRKGMSLRREDMYDCRA